MQTTLSTTKLISYSDEQETPEKHAPRSRVLGMPAEALAGISFCTASTSMILLNKAALSSYHFGAPTCLLLFQCVVTLLLVLLWQGLGYTRLQALDLQLVRAWLPVNFLFVGMVWSSFYALKYVGVAMVTVLKNLTNFLVIFGDMAFFGKTYSRPVWFTLFLMLLSAVCGAYTDLEFDVRGYTWQFVNNFFTAGYSLALRHTITRMNALTARKGGMDEFSMVFYNNLLSIPLIFVLLVGTGELTSVLQEPALQQLGFQIAAGVSALIGFFISVASMWFMSTTTATTFSLVGSLNKIPIAVLGMLLFNTPMNLNNILSVSVGLLAGVIFVRTKAMEAR